MLLCFDVGLLVVVLASAAPDPTWTVAVASLPRFTVRFEPSISRPMLLADVNVVKANVVRCGVVVVVLCRVCCVVVACSVVVCWPRALPVHV